MKGSGGSIVSGRYGDKTSHSLVIELPPEVDPVTGEKKRKQKWIAFRGSKKQAQNKLRQLLTDLEKGIFVEPSNLTLLPAFLEWVEEAKDEWRDGTYESYRSFATNHLTGSAIANMPLQRLTAKHIKDFYKAETVKDSTEPLAESTLLQHHSILHSFLEAMVDSEKVYRNVASKVIGKPQPREDAEIGLDIAANCWTAIEAKKFVETAQGAGPQNAAMYTFEVETGLRKGELCGLPWGPSGLDLERGHVRVMQQLLCAGTEPVFGQTKTGKPRTIALSAKTLKLLRIHKEHQDALKLAHGPLYHDHGLAFAIEWKDLPRYQGGLGRPLELRMLGKRHLDPLIEAAGVKRITFHGLRHTSATLLLERGVNPKIVQERLGHAKITITLKYYAHVLPGMQEGASALISGLLSD